MLAIVGAFFIIAAILAILPAIMYALAAIFSAIVPGTEAKKPAEKNKRFSDLGPGEVWK